MANDTKGCNLFQSEIEELIAHHGHNLGDDVDGRMDRLKYLHSRLKAFKEPEEAKTETKPVPAAAGWGTPTT